MRNPELYVLAGEGDDKGDWATFADLDLSKEQALKLAMMLKIPQRVYKLVLVYEVGVKTVHEFPITDFTAQGNYCPDDRRDWSEADRLEAERSKPL